MKGPKQIYFLRPIGQEGPIKIGCSINVKSRLSTVLLWSPVKLEIAAVTNGGHEYERQLHARFARQRLHGEWFAPCPDLTNLIRSIANGGDLPAVEARPHRWNRDPSADEIEKIVQAYAAGASLVEIGQILNWSTSKVRRVLIMNGQTPRRAGRVDGMALENISRAKQMQQLRRQGATLQVIADKFGLTRQRVEQVLKKAASDFLDAESLAA